MTFKRPLESLFDFWLPSPLQPLTTGIFSEYDNHFYVKRDDLIHHHISGNKYRKLEFNYLEFLEGNYQEIVAFGGAFSNLLYTLSFIAKAGKVPMTFYVRGDGFDPENPTLKTIEDNGVKLVWLNRHEFRKKMEPTHQTQFLTEHPGAYIIPEGASNELSIPGAARIVTEITEQLKKTPEHIVMDMGTAGTFCGALSILPASTKLTGIPVLKGVDWQQTIRRVMGKSFPDLSNKHFEIREDYHFGGFSKYNDELIRFINDFRIEYGIPLDPIYTGKLVFGVTDLMRKGYFEKGSTVVWVHAGGLQGIDGFNYLHGNLISG